MPSLPEDISDRAIGEVPDLLMKVGVEDLSLILEFILATAFSGRLIGGGLLNSLKLAVIEEVEHV